MQRLTARLLLLFALVGSLVPLALAATSAPRACCFRKGLHHCQDSPASESEQPVIRDATCSNHDCCRAVTTGKWACSQPRLALSFLETINALLTEAHPSSPANPTAEFRPSRAPPAC
jgi:hypothetical protein